jgi:acetyltransferase
VIRPEDESLLVAFHDRNSEHTIRMRFFSLVKELSRDRLIRLCHLDYDREIALVALHHDGERDTEIVGVSRYYLDPQTGDAEFALVVGDAWQGHGLGYHLMQRLIEIARQNGVARLVGCVLRENATMLKLIRELGFTFRAELEGGIVEVALALPPTGADA